MSSTLFRSSSSVLPTTIVTRIRTKTSRASAPSLWLSRTHLKSKPVVPPPIPPTYPMRVILSDGSSFTAYTTAPTPSTKKLTRDVNNNPLWSPASEKKGLGEGEEGRVTRFRKRFEGLGGDIIGGIRVEGETKGDAFALEDLDWMSEGAQEEKISDRQRNPVKSKGKGKKK
ncbi:hypothetical protein I307_06417 [Cryptococcus deuterogattii 99/473]|uniref:Uncharacterized protein n=2 Tax=Cryptococcus deuterogattii TaxID=1859096 RepID=A0A0D0U5W8_9TREE|nr:hypothetical protein CNBG_3317 [Cryptococcus deuterogattii R265]KIR37108.1 hypothetical protein I352_00420 [Cryptococcus deuterogattii MMRL2647]KIR43578.1 hypothetical protein I313_00420 [Cryptococcus deuterogattii Ram5]KIR74912.1 hypothetical protein I310_01186 [Cryptococcus deuterogattii CA1014]KIS01327.1 hypothetical protein L804_01205 [Cryptococcus deuterogattii 2001/935-1]KIY54242.1 hypothetical protein I307_06417 [Cryptococcus deuterogattii 99/473]